MFPTTNQLRPFTTSISQRYAANRWSVVAEAPDKCRRGHQPPPAPSRRKVLSSIVFAGNVAVAELGRAPDAHAAGAFLSEIDCLGLNLMVSMLHPTLAQIGTHLDVHLTSLGYNFLASQDRGLSHGFCRASRKDMLWHPLALASANLQRPPNCCPKLALKRP